MTHEEILRTVDHTLLLQGSTWEEIKTVCDDAIKYSCASVCIPPYFVKRSSDYVNGRIKICTVIGFPNGNNNTKVKAFETEEALKDGADEIDMVINIGMVKQGDYDSVKNEIVTLKDICGDRILKVIIETCLLTDSEKYKMCEIVSSAGADYIKTSTGFAGGGATFDDVKLMVENVREGVKVKAAGGIKSLEDAERFLELGASRLGTSRIVKIIKGM